MSRGWSCLGFPARQGLSQEECDTILWGVPEVRQPHPSHPLQRKQQELSSGEGGNKGCFSGGIRAVTLTRPEPEEDGLHRLIPHKYLLAGSWLGSGRIPMAWRLPGSAVGAG